MKAPEAKLLAVSHSITIRLRGQLGRTFPMARSYIFRCHSIPGLRTYVPPEKDYVQWEYEDINIANWEVA